MTFAEDNGKFWKFRIKTARFIRIVLIFCSDKEINNQKYTKILYGEQHYIPASKIKVVKRNKIRQITEVDC